MPREIDRIACAGTDALLCFDFEGAKKLRAALDEADLYMATAELRCRTHTEETE